MKKTSVLYVETDETWSRLVVRALSEELSIEVVTCFSEDEFLDRRPEIVARILQGDISAAIWGSLRESKRPPRRANEPELVGSVAAAWRSRQSINNRVNPQYFFPPSVFHVGLEEALCLGRVGINASTVITKNEDLAELVRWVQENCLRNHPGQPALASHTLVGARF